MNKAIFIGLNALGDTLCTTPIIRSFKKMNPRTFVVYILQNSPFCRVLEGNPHIDYILYNEHMYVHGLKNFTREWLLTLPLDITGVTALYHFDMPSVSLKPGSADRHLAEGFSELLKIPIDSTYPDVVITSGERKLAKHFVRKPYFVLSFHSLCNPILPGHKSGLKDWNMENWFELAGRLHSLGDYDVIAVGAERDTQVISPLFRNLYGLPIKVTAALLQEAACVITLENGVGHLCAAAKAPHVVLFPENIPRPFVDYPGIPRRHVIFKNLQNIRCDEVMEAVQTVLSS